MNKLIFMGIHMYSHEYTYIHKYICTFVHLYTYVYVYLYLNILYNNYVYFYWIVRRTKIFYFSRDEMWNFSTVVGL